jgi:hypothetical protein
MQKTPYSEKAKAARRCKATRRDGQPCRAWALWNGDGLCAGHAYKRRGKASEQYRYSGMPTNAPACICNAYAWPHRPGSGLCNWPDAPKWRSTIPAGTHSYIRGYKQRYRVLLRHWGKDVNDLLQAGLLGSFLALYAQTIQRAMMSLRGYCGRSI